MRILLIPPKSNYPHRNPSEEIIGQGFPYIAGALRAAGHEVSAVMLDHNWCIDSASETLFRLVQSAVAEFVPELIGVGGLTADYHFLRDCINICRKVSPSTPIVCGGGAVTYDSEYVFSDLKPDFAVIGEAERTIVNLVDCLGSAGNLAEIEGIAFWKGDQACFTLPSVFVDNLDDLPYPDYTPFSYEKTFAVQNPIDFILSHSRKTPRIMPITLGRSCPFSCTFCCHKTGSTYRERSIKSALKEIAFMHEQHNFNVLLVYDELLAVKQDRILELCNGIQQIKKDLSIDFDWTCALRPVNLDLDVLKSMKDAGCTIIGFGLESASQRILDSMKKKTFVQQIQLALQATSEAGLGVQGNFIFGDPAETIDTIDETMSFFHSNCEDLIINLGYITPYPGSELFDNCLRSGLIKDRHLYYSQIGGIGSYRINMTQIPDNIYFSKVDEIAILTDPIESQLQISEAYVSECNRIAMSPADASAPFNAKRFIYEIIVCCPHCKNYTDYNYPARANDVRNAKRFAVCKHCHKRFKLSLSDHIKGDNSYQIPAKLLEQGFEKFNIIHYGSNYFAVHQSLGSFDVAAIDEHEKDSLIRADKLIVKPVLKELKQQILRKRLLPKSECLNLKEAIFRKQIHSQLPYFGDFMHAFQGDAERHRYMIMLIAQESLRLGTNSISILEIGSWAGGSALTWAEALSKHHHNNGRILCIDPWVTLNSTIDGSEATASVYEEMASALTNDCIYNLFLHNLNSSPYGEIIDHKRGTSKEVLSQLTSQTFNVIFIDGSHDAVSVIHDIKASIPLLSEGGIICGDDLELQIGEVDYTFAENNKHVDFCRDPLSNRYFHPGVTIAVHQELGEVSAWKGFWAMRRRCSRWEKIYFFSDEKQFNYPCHIGYQSPPVMVETGYYSFNLISYAYDIYAIHQNAGPVDLPNIDYDKFNQLLKEGKILTAKTIAETKQLIENTISPIKLYTGINKHHQTESRMNNDYETATLFSAGNYIKVALLENKSDWRTYAALGIIGFSDRAITGLQQFDCAEARFYLGVAHWIAGDEASAMHHLQHVDLPHAQNLLKLIQQPQISVLAQIEQQQWLSIWEHDPKFCLRHIGTSPSDVPVAPYADVREYCKDGFSPDFYICRMAEWQMIPPNISEISCPTFAHTGDYDAHIQTVYPWLKQFDELIVCEETQWEELRHITGGNVCSIIKGYSIKPNPLPSPDAPREIDIFVSGTLFHPYHPDKASLINQLLNLHEIKSVLIDGFVSSGTYEELTSNSKICLSHVRYPRGTQTRALESLSMGCAVIVHRENTLNLYGGEQEGIFRYDVEGESLEQTATRIVANWPAVAYAAQRGAKKIQEEFNTQRVASSYLRFLTFLAAKPRDKRAVMYNADLCHKRGILWKGWRQTSDTYKQMYHLSISRLVDKMSGSATPTQIIDIARDGVLEHASRTYPPVAMDFYSSNNDYQNADDQNLSSILEIYWSGILHFPKSLVLRFNLIRTALHLGKPHEVEAALNLAQETIRVPIEEWHIDPMEDVFPWDFFCQCFNYRGYFDAVTRQLSEQDPQPQPLAALISASIHYYLSFYFENECALLNEAISLDPEFPFYQYRYALKLNANTIEADKLRAVHMLMNLAEDSIIFEEAYEALVKMPPHLRVPIERFERVSRKYNQSKTSIFRQRSQIENWHDPYLRMSSSKDKAGTSGENSCYELPVFSAEAGCGTKKTRILYISMQFTTWSNARPWSYPTYLGFEDGFQANDVEYLTIPCFHGISASLPASWLFHVKELCRGKQFDQIWIELFHSYPDNDFLEYLIELAPVRLALLPESLEFDRTDYALSPGLISRKFIVESKLKYMTHALVADEKDAKRLGESGIIKTKLWVPSMPRRFITPTGESSCEPFAVMLNSELGIGKKLSRHPDVHPLLSQIPLSVGTNNFLAAFDKVNATVLSKLHGGMLVNQELLEAYQNILRSFYTDGFLYWLEQLKQFRCIVNPPTSTKNNSCHVFECMAAGRPVISWEIDGRPSTAGQFKHHQEILLYPTAQPEILSQQIRLLNNDLEFANYLSNNAQDKLINLHTAEKRVREILYWIKTGLELDEPHASSPSDTCYNKLDTLLPAKEADPIQHFNAINQFQSKFDESGAFTTSSESIKIYLKGPAKDLMHNVTDSVSNALMKPDIPEAISILENAALQFPELNEPLSQLYKTIGLHEKAACAGLVALSLSPGNPDLLIDIAQISLLAGNASSAYSYYYEALLSSPSKKQIMPLLKSFWGLADYGKIQNGDFRI